MQDAAEEPGEGNQLLVGLFIPIWPTVQRRIFQTYAELESANANARPMRYFQIKVLKILRVIRACGNSLMGIIAAHFCPYMYTTSET